MSKRAVEQRGATSAKAPTSAPLARTDLVGKVARERFEEEITRAVDRRGAGEAKLAGAIRAVLPLSAPLRAQVGETLRLFVKRRTVSRELYTGGIRALAELADPKAKEIVAGALLLEEAGGPATLGAAALSSAPELRPLLSKIAAGNKSHVSFAAEVARVVRGEANGTHLAALAPMIKESHRIALCTELFLPLSRGAAAPRTIAPALALLSEAERHLGRWLVFAEVVTKTGDGSLLDLATSRAATGPASSRSAWELVRWALEQVAASQRGAPVPVPPPTRPTVELVARLSDRPSADRDLAFLFRLAQARAAAAKPMLDAVHKQAALGDDGGIRAALYLARDHGRDDLVAALVAVAGGSKKEELRGPAAAALWDLGRREEALAVVDELASSRILANVAWSVLLRAAQLRGAHEDLATEAHFRWLSHGSVE